MRRSVLLLLVILSPHVRSQETTRRGAWWVTFREKPVPADRSPEALGISPRALDRRAKVLPPHALIDASDFPVSEPYLLSLRDRGVRIRSVSRWLNAASIESDTGQAEELRRLPHVLRVDPVRTARRPPLPAAIAPPPRLLKSSAATVISYGPSLTQNQTLNAVPLHELGVFGHGVLVGMIDDGFNNHRTHPGLRGITVVAEYDFIQRDSNTSVAPGEFSSQGFHGAATLSVVGGFEEGQIVGAAYGASFVLAKTEIDSIEVVQEEDNYVEGLEWLERQGADIISSSLGYIDWYTYANMDGQTAITTRTARTLAAKGVLLVTAMGNEGNFRPGTSTTGTLIAPSDADSILSVGAAQPNGNLASFSSTGPTADGRIKPDVTAQGTSMWVARGTQPTGYYFSQGTSFSTPQTAAAAALVLSVHPEATPMQLRDAIRNSAFRRNDGTSRTTAWPNNYYGWGLVDAYAAALSLGPVVSNIPLVRYAVVGDEPSLIVTVRSATNGVPDPSRTAVFARRTTESTFNRYALTAGSQAGMLTARIPVSGPADTLYVGYVTIADAGGQELRRPAAPALFDLHPTPDSLARLLPGDGAPGVPSTYILHPNFPNPFNAGTVIVFSLPRAERVELTVHTLLGQKVRTLFRGVAPAGDTPVTWTDLTDERGRSLASGVYLVRLSAPGSTVSRRMTLLK